MNPWDRFHLERYERLRKENEALRREVERFRRERDDAAFRAAHPTLWPERTEPVASPFPWRRVLLVAIITAALVAFGLLTGLTFEG